MAANSLSSFFIPVEEGNSKWPLIRIDGRTRSPGQEDGEGDIQNFLPGVRGQAGQRTTFQTKEGTFPGSARSFSRRIQACSSLLDCSGIVYWNPH